MCEIFIYHLWVLSVFVHDHPEDAQIGPIMAILDSQQNFLSIPSLVESVTLQVEGAGWGLQSSKLKGLSRMYSPFPSPADHFKVFLSRRWAS